MGKKKSNGSTPMKSYVKKPQITNMMKILRPKVYIIDSHNFKSLVQQLTGNGEYHKDSHHHHNTEEGMSVAPSLKCEMEICKGLEAMLMETDSDSCDNYDIACNYDHIFQQDLDNQHQICEYDYDLSNFIF